MNVSNFKVSDESEESLPTPKKTVTPRGRKPATKPAIVVLFFTLTVQLVFIWTILHLKDDESDESEEERKPARKRQKADSGSEFEEFDEESNSESSVSFLMHYLKQIYVEISIYIGRRAAVMRITVQEKNLLGRKREEEEIKEDRRCLVQTKMVLMKTGKNQPKRNARRLLRKAMVDPNPVQ